MSLEQKQKKIRQRRGTSRALKLLRWKFKILSVIPPLAARSVFDLWFLTRRFPSPAREQRWMDGAQKISIDTEVGNIQTYAWGEGPLVLLVHGWNGRGLQLGAFVQPLLEQGYQIVTVDLPGHGQSDGSHTNIFRITKALLALQQHYSEPHAIIAHSFGATAVSYALNRGLQSHYFVSISAPLNTKWLIERFTNAFRLKPATIKGFKQLLDQRFGNGAVNLISTQQNIATLALPVMIIHDRDDTDVPWQHAEALAKQLPSAKLVITEGLGHRRILRNRKVIEQVLKFIS